MMATTAEREEAIPLPREKFSEGKLPKESYASPWTVTTLKIDNLQKKLGRVNEETLESITSQVNVYVIPD